MSTNPPTQKRGRPTEYVKDGNNDPIIGLSKEKDGRYYATGTAPKVRFGTNFDRALIRFREWQNKTQKKRIKARDWSNHPKGSPHEPYETEWNGHPLTIVPVPKTHSIPEEIFWAVFREKMAQDPKRCAESSGYPLDRLQDYPEPGASLTLREIGDLYQKRLIRRNATTQSRSDGKRYWNEFVEMTGASTIGDLSAAVVNKYYDDINDERRENNRSPNFLINRFSVIRQALKEAFKLKKNTEKLTQLVVLVKSVFENPERSEANPQPISRENFLKWYNAADVKHQAILLVMLNAGYRQSDIADLRWKDRGATVVDLVAGTIVNRRKKKGQVKRCCKLWDRTIDAIKAYLKTLPPGEHTHVFLNEINTPCANGHIVARGLRVSKPKGVHIEHIRDGTESVADLKHIRQTDVNILMGHSNGISDRYHPRTPSAVEDACAALEKMYFPE